MPTIDMQDATVSSIRQESLNTKDGTDSFDFTDTGDDTGRQSGDDEAEDSITIDYGAIRIEYVHHTGGSAFELTEFTIRGEYGTDGGDDGFLF